jgi:cytidine deaminase
MPKGPTERLQELVDLAAEARRNAYAPYSKYAVGAALRTRSGQVFAGVNVENAAYPHTMCAERVAVFAAVTAGEREFEAIAVVTENGGPPCGGCRQVLAEFGLETVVLLANAAGQVLEQTTVGGLLPGAFAPEHLVGRR